MTNKNSTTYFIMRRYGIWGLVLSLHGAILSQFLGAPEFNFGIYNQTEPIVTGIHFCAALASISLAAIFCSTKKIGMLVWHPIVLFPVGVSLWSLLVGLTHNFPFLNWFGAAELGEGILWYFELGLFVAAAAIVKKFRIPRLSLVSSAICVTIVVTVLTLQYLDTVLIYKPLPRFIPFYFADYLGFSGIYLVAIAAIFLRGTNRTIILAGIIAGLLVIYFSSNRAAWGLVFIAAPVLVLTGTFLKHHLSSLFLRYGFAVIITTFIIASTTILSTVDFRHYAEKFETFGEETFGTMIHSAINSQATRQHLHTLSLEAIKNKPNILLLGQGWGMFSDYFASYLPVEWVKLRDDQNTWTESERWLAEGHWDAVNRVDFHSHNSYLEALLSIGIIGVILVLGITLAPILWCRKNFIILAGVVGFASSGLLTQWFMVPASMPLFAIALGGFVNPIKAMHFFHKLHKLMPWCAIGFAILFIFVGSTNYKFVTYAFHYMPKMTQPILTKNGQLVCTSYFEDYGRGGVHLAHRLRTLSKYVKKQILKTEDLEAGEEKYLFNHLRGLVCASEYYIDRGASIRLLIASLHTRADYAFIEVPNKMKPLVDRFLQNWGARVRQLVEMAPKRTDLAVPYLLYLLKNGNDKEFSDLASSLFIRNADDPIALWFSGVALLSKPNLGISGTQRMRLALEKGVERLIPVDQALKRELLPEELTSTSRYKKLILETKRGTVSINVELAATLEEGDPGLSGRTSLATNTGMLILYPEVKHIEVLMSDTYIPLDLLFIDSNGLVKEIVTNARPLSLKKIQSNKIARGVLQLNAGFVKKFGIQVGDRLVTMENLLK